ncbi:MAG: type restriction enzyme subunit [Carnobacterium sp.]|uniref:restriction endonuclease subunit S n=1 Tax=Carnobacterium sp. TaxID=48221 RepID=UPI0026493091|nr:restriction endonuclease subunit S [Carnobacterium sp.]MDN5371875.1 type restriction enzyme subunit [Carnobacterium sp.]
MSKIINLREIAEIKNGFAFKSKDFCEEGIPIVKIKNITPPKISIDDAQYVSKEIYEDTKQYELNYNDILISMTGSGVNQMSSAVGKVGRVRYKNKSLQNQRVGKVIVKDESRYNVDFLYYYLSMNKTLEYFVMNSSGSANQANISKDIIERLEVPDFDILDQNRIANILLSLDNKVENNNAIIANLEEQALTIFKSWFVNFEPYQNEEFVDSELGVIPKDLQIKQLSELFEIKYGKNLPTKKLEEKGYPVFGGNGQIGFYHEYLYEESKLLISCRGAASGKIVVSLPYSFITNNSLIMNEFKRSYFHYYRYLFNTIEFENYATGSAQPQITITNIKDLKVYVPNESMINKFNMILTPIFDTQINLQKENGKLVELRDTLLPKLMSGEIQVEEALEAK